MAQQSLAPLTGRSPSTTCICLDWIGSEKYGIVLPLIWTSLQSPSREWRKVFKVRYTPLHDQIDSLCSLTPFFLKKLWSVILLRCRNSSVDMCNTRCFVTLQLVPCIVIYPQGDPVFFRECTRSNVSMPPRAYISRSCFLSSVRRILPHVTSITGTDLESNICGIVRVICHSAKISRLMSCLVV